MTKINFGVNQPLESIRLEHQTIDAAVNLNDSVYSESGVWKQANQDSPAPVFSNIV